MSEKLRKPTTTSFRPAANLLASPLLRPALRAFLIGYLLDVVPAIFKQILRYALVNGKNIAKVRKRIRLERMEPSSDEVMIQEEGRRKEIAVTSLYADGVSPALRQIPALLQSVAKAIVTSLDPTGVGFTCALAMAGMAVMDQTISRLLGLHAKETASSARSKADNIRLMSVGSTFISAATSSFLALVMLQHVALSPDTSQGDPSSTSNSARSSASIGSLVIPFRRKNAGTEIPTPLAPGGHFLARLTNLSIPATPKDQSGSRSPVNQNKQPSPVEEKSSAQTPTQRSTSPPNGSEKLGTASPTIDLTLFALVRAMDTLVRATPFLMAKVRSNNKLSRSAQSKGLGPAAGMRHETPRNSASRGQPTLIIRALQAIGGYIGNQAEGLTFVIACSVIMFNWFYHPERLPPSYVKWITNLAAMDQRLLVALRSVRYGKPHPWVYGSSADPPTIDLLGSLSESLGHPYSWGDPTRVARTNDDAKRKKVEADKTGSEYVCEGAAGLRGKGEMGGMPCEIVHCGVGGSNCYLNALYRWLKAWKVCMGIYVPVHLLPRLIFDPAQFAREPIPAITKVLKGSIRSASFLSTYIASIWFMVCFNRTLVLPRLFPKVSYQFWDGGSGPLLGSFACGWSVFIEEKRKRAEMALYVCPRALFALAEMAKPGWLSQGERSALRTERMFFGMSVGIVIAAAKHRPDLLRGITALMTWVVAQPKPAGRVSSGKITAKR